MLVHNRYQRRAGEDQLFDWDRELLERHGHAVEVLLFDNEEIKTGLPGLVHAGAETVWSRRASRLVAQTLDRFKPEVVQFHNTFPMVSPAAYRPCAERGVPVVQRLDNYRLVCPKAVLFRDGARCTDCVGKRLPWPAVRHRCYRGSAAGSAVVSSMLALHGSLGTWRHVDRFIAPSEATATNVAAGGFPRSRITVRPNYLPHDPGARDADDLPPDAPYVFAGRLEPEKGVATLLQAWSGRGESLVIAGDGSLRPEVEVAAAAHPNIEYRGWLEATELDQLVRSAAAVVFPSVWAEPFGLQLIEAFAVGVPVLSSDSGAAPEIVEDGRSGWLFPAGDPVGLAALLDRARDQPQRLRSMGSAARDVFLERYGADEGYRSLLSVLEAVVRGGQSGHGASEQAAPERP